MRDQLAAHLNSAITTILLIVVVLTPLFFTPFFTEFYETSKVVLLVVAVLITIILWTLSWVVRGKVFITRSPLDLSFILLALVVILSTVFSSTQYISIFGNFPRLHGSAVSYIAYILLYFVALSHLRTRLQVTNLLYAMLVSGVIVAVVSMLAYFNLYLPFPITKFQNFTPTGSSFSTAALLALLLPIPLVSIIREKKLLPDGASVAIATLFTVTIVLIGGNNNSGFSILLSAPFVAVYFVYGMIYLMGRGGILARALPMLVIPIAISVLVGILSSLSIGGNFNVLNQKAKDFPREVQLGFNTSWKVAASVFRDNPFLGTGPATYLFNFTAYRPIEHNETKFWNIRFDSGFNEYLQIFGTMGLLGLLAFVFFSVIVLNFGYRGLSDRENTLAAALSASVLVGLVLLVMHTSTVVVMVALIIILAMLMAVHKSIGSKVEELTIGIRASKLYDSNLIVGDVLPVIIFIPVVFFTIFALWQTGTMVLADYNHRMALNSASNRGLDTYNYLVAAENLNPRVDLYRIDLAQTNFALANAIAVSKGPSESSPGGSLTDQDKLNIQQLLSQSIREGQIATSLSPRNPANWEILGSIYRQISGVADNALSFALNSYGQAIQRDPLNPLLRISVGGIYYSVRNYDLAIRFFSDAINLKPDLANAYYNLSITLRDKGDLENAQATAERLVAILQEDTNNPDYKVASEYLADLKARIATGSAQQSGFQPTATSSGALQKKNLPQVLDLPEPQKEATPPAVKR